MKDSIKLSLKREVSQTGVGNNKYLLYTTLIIGVHGAEEPSALAVRLGHDQTDLQYHA